MVFAPCDAILSRCCELPDKNGIKQNLPEANKQRLRLSALSTFLTVKAGHGIRGSDVYRNFGKRISLGVSPQCQLERHHTKAQNSDRNIHVCIKNSFAAAPRLTRIPVHKKIRASCSGVSSFKCGHLVEYCLLVLCLRVLPPQASNVFYSFKISTKFFCVRATVC